MVKNQLFCKLWLVLLLALAGGAAHAQIDSGEAEEADGYRRKANAGDVEAMRELAKCYMEGYGVYENKAEALKWFTKAAMKGHAASEFDLATMYEKGEGTAVNYTEALKWYRKAAAHAIPANAGAYNSITTAMLRVGRCYQEGRGVQKNAVEAVRWYNRAHAKQHPAASTYLGVCYMCGDGVSKDPEKGMKLIREAYGAREDLALEVWDALTEFVKKRNDLDQLRQLARRLKDREKSGVEGADLALRTVQSLVKVDLLADPAPTSSTNSTPSSSPNSSPERETTPAPASNTTTNQQTLTAATTPTDTQIYDVSEVMPSFPGGTDALMQFLSSHIVYPLVCEENGIQGRVICSFIVETDGSVSNIQVVKSVDPALDREAKRVLSSMPKWNPGLVKGKPARVKYTVPVIFRLK